MKKLVSILLVLLMVFAVACTSKPAETPDKPTTGGAVEAANDVADWPVVSVDVLSFTDTLERADEVEAALNEYLVSIDAGVQAEFIIGTWGDRATNLTMLLADKDNPIDLFCWRFYSSVDSLVKNDQIISMEDYKAVYPELWNVYPEAVYKTNQVKGVQYALPIAESFGGFTGYYLRKSVAEEIGVDNLDGQELSLEELNEILLKAEAAHPDQAWWADMKSLPLLGIDSLGNSYWLGVLRNRGVGETEIINYYASPEFRAWCEQTKWYNENGMIPDDPINTVPTGTLYADHVTSGQYCDGHSLDYIRSLMKGHGATEDGDFVLFKLNDFVGTNDSVSNGWCISSLSKHPDAAMKLLYLMATDENVCRFFTLGIENVTYKITEQGTATLADGVDDSTVGWNLSACWFYPNQCLSIPYNTDDTEVFNQIMACWTDESAQYSNAMGFVFDNSAVYDQVKACEMVVDQYRDALLFGMVDVDEYLAKFNEELTKAGIDDIIAAMNEQYTEFLKGK